MVQSTSPNATGESKEMHFGKAKFGPSDVEWSSNKQEFLGYAHRVGSRLGDFEDRNNYLAIMRTALEKARTEMFAAGPDQVRVTDDEIHQVEKRVAETIGSQMTSKMNPQQYVEECRRAGLSDNEIYDVAMRLVLSRRTYSPSYKPTPEDIGFFAKTFNKDEKQVRQDVITGIMKDYGLDSLDKGSGRALVTKDFYAHLFRALQSYGYSGDETFMTINRLRNEVESRLRAEPAIAYSDPLHNLTRELREQYPQLVNRDSGNMNNLELPLRLIERASLEAHRKNTSWAHRRMSDLRRGLVKAGLMENPDTKLLNIKYPRRQIPVAQPA